LRHLDIVPGSADHDLRGRANRDSFSGRCVFLTGASGLLGTELLRLIDGAKVFALVRREDQARELAARGIRPVLGDLSRERLGISDRDRHDIVSSVTDIIHAAADIRFDLTLAESRAVNLFGVQEMLELAFSCRRLEKFLHVSTVYVNGHRQGVFAEAPVPHGQRFVNYYQQSKFEAEGLVLEAMRRIPAAIYRLSLVIADSVDGNVSQYNYFHHLLRWLPGSPLPVIPGDPNVLVDLVPNDWVAAALAHLFTNRFAAGSIRHLCAGPELSIRLAEAMERICRVVESHPSNRSGRRIETPQLVSLGEYNRFLGNCRDAEIAALADLVGHHVRLLAIRQVHLNALATEELKGSGVAPPDPISCLQNTTRFCLDTQWGRKAPQSVAAAD
jgi:nucleoside-diphosphate-sugar epimerase